MMKEAKKFYLTYNYKEKNTEKTETDHLTEVL